MIKKDRTSQPVSHSGMRTFSEEQGRTKVFVEAHRLYVADENLRRTRLFGKGPFMNGKLAEFEPELQLPPKNPLRILKASKEKVFKKFVFGNGPLNRLSIL